MCACGYNVIYDGDDDTTADDFLGLGSVDLTDGGHSNAFRVRVVRSTDIELGIEVSQQERPGDDTFANLQIVPPAVAAPTDFLLPFTDFSNPGCNFCADTSPLTFGGIDPTRCRSAQ